MLLKTKALHTWKSKNSINYRVLAQVVEKVNNLPERAKKVKSKAIEKSVIEAYISTSIERAFQINAAICLF